MATKPDALSFCRTYLRRSPKATFAQIRDAAKKKRLTLWPVSYGRALSLEGLVKSKPRKSKKKTGKKRGPGRPKGSKNKRPGVKLSGLDGLVSTLQALQKERDEAVKVLDKIRDLVS